MQFINVSVSINTSTHGVQRSASLAVVVFRCGSGSWVTSWFGTLSELHVVVVAHVSAGTCSGSEVNPVIVGGISIYKHHHPSTQTHDTHMYANTDTSPPPPPPPLGYHLLGRATKCMMASCANMLCLILVLGNSLFHFPGNLISRSDKIDSTKILIYLQARQKCVAQCLAWGGGLGEGRV